MSIGGSQLSMRDAEKLAAGEPVCRHCYHWLSAHHVLHPCGAEAVHETVLSCVEHTVDPLFGTEFFCDCVIDVEVDPGA